MVHFQLHPDDAQCNDATICQHRLVIPQQLAVAAELLERRGQSVAREQRPSLLLDPGLQRRDGIQRRGNDHRKLRAVPRPDGDLECDVVGDGAVDAATGLLPTLGAPQQEVVVLDGPAASPVEGREQQLRGALVEEVRAEGVEQELEHPSVDVARVADVEVLEGMQNL